MKKKKIKKETFYNTGTFGRPDTSGIRGQGANMKAYDGGGEDFPYDKERGKWGEPHAYSRDSAGHGGSHRTVPTPKTDVDIDRWADDIEEMGVDGWVSATPPAGNITSDPGSKSIFGDDDDETEIGDDKNEAMGVPFNVAKGGQGTGGGRTMPGTGGAWSSGPTGGAWDNKLDDDELEDKMDEFMSGLPIRPNIAYKVNPRQDDQSLDDPVDFDDPVDAWFFKNSPQYGNIGNAMKHSRHSPGFSWKESHDSWPRRRPRPTGRH